MWKKASVLKKSIVVLYFVGVIYYIFFRNSSIMESFGNPTSCTYYYMTNCGHCKTFTPEWDKFVQNYTGNIEFKKVEMNQAGNDIEKYNIKGFPTVLIMDDAGETKEYDGPRTSAGLKKYFENM
jgi:thiol-disulfide isomerase/thioredoxin|tara:strand:+ start:19801 stop:20172 length:372 start_codon:yes stop_codon:yes gene_type:complete